MTEQGEAGNVAVVVGAIGVAREVQKESEAGRTFCASGVLRKTRESRLQFWNLKQFNSMWRGDMVTAHVPASHCFSEH
jgi:GTP cyclohydrolase I